MSKVRERRWGSDDKYSQFDRSVPNLFDAPPPSRSLFPQMIDRSPVADKSEDIVDEHVDAEDDDEGENEGVVDPAVASE